MKVSIKRLDLRPGDKIKIIMFWMRNKENIFSIRTLIWRPVVYFKSSIFVQKDFQSHLPPSCGQGRMIRLDV